MSGEYFCIEEVDPASYYEDYGTKNKVTKPRDKPRYHKSRDHDARSISSKKSQDLILYEIEEQLKVAENRCNTLKGHIHSMKKIYQNTGKTETAPQTRKPHMLHEHKKITTEDTFKRKISRRHSNSPPNTKSRSCTPSKRLHPTAQGQDSSDAIPHKSSSSSTNLQHEKHFHHQTRKGNFTTTLIRQNSPSIGTDTTGAATRTMNSILTGIADSVNRITQIHCNPKETMKVKKNEPDAMNQFSEGPTLQIPCQLSPRVEKRILEQKRKVDEILKIKKLPVELHAMDTWNRPKFSATSMKSKVAKTAWSRHTRSKTPSMKTKIQFSSGSINITKPIKSTAKHVENTTKLHPTGNIMVDEESPSTIIKRKRKRALKRLHPNSSKYETRRCTPNGLMEQPCPSSKLIELYHNIAAKTSDSDESNHLGNKSHATRQKGGGDLPITTAQIVPSYDNTEIRAISPSSKTVNRIFTPTRILTPINEHVYMKTNTNGTSCLSNFTRNYELPTIASKLKQVAKSYLSSFNFRKIPFCVAKSTTASHNIGVNIQQVMSIMKTKQPVVGLSPTLTHNIGLAAGRFHDVPLTALVSTLSTKMAYRQSHCPLSLKTNMNYCQLQEMAKTIEEEPCEDRPGFAGDGGSQTAIENAPTNITTEAKEETVETPEWSTDPAHVEQCTCATQNIKGIPFSEVLNKYHVSSECIKNMKPSHVLKANLSQQRQCKSTYGTATQKNRTKNWVNATTVPVVPVVQPQKECGDLQGKERNLKTVLTNLYEEFNNLNNKYEVLSKEINQNNSEASDVTLKELEDMENMLGKKEEEINMVMSLYTEVLALKDQVKKLREKASLSGCSVNNTINNQQLKVSEYKEPNTAAHLTQLLRQIQNYQIHCKSKVN